MDHPVAVAVDDQGRHIDMAELGSAVPRAEDAGQLPRHTAGGRVTIPADAGEFAHPALVERETVRSDVAEDRFGAVHRLGPVRGGRAVTIRRHVDGAGRPTRRARWST